MPPPRRRQQQRTKCGHPDPEPCSPVPRSPLHPPPPHTQQAGEQIAVLNPKTEGGGRRRGRAAALGAHLAPEPGEPRGGQETREPPLPAPPSRPPPPPPSRRCLPGFEPRPAEPRAPVETKTDRTAGTAATGSGGPDPGARRGRRAPPVRCTKEPGRPVPRGGLGLGRRRHSPECWAAGSVGPSQARGFGGRLSSGRGSDAGARQLRRSP
nr:potassium/sodium hyperpolarization-activated cyclic nucleotide-gated channel 2-like [Globicephala melas]